MNNGILPVIGLLCICAAGRASSAWPDTNPLRSSIMQPDTLGENQDLYNGREWKNLYSHIGKDQFFLSGAFLSGSLTMQGKTFHNLNLQYDLYKDEILTPMADGVLLQLNKELVDSFSVFFQGRVYRFARLPEDRITGLNGYAQVIYAGKTNLFVKYIKKIDRPGVENKRDSFYQTSRMYLVKDNLAFLISGKSDLFKVLNDKRAQLKDFMRRNPARLSVKDPESYMAVLRYYDIINQ